MMRKNVKKLMDDFNSIGIDVIQYEGTYKPAILKCNKHNIEFVVASMRRRYLDECICPLCKQEHKMNKYKGI